MVRRLRLALSISLVATTMGFATAGSPSIVQAATCSWQAETSHVVQLFPSYSSWINVVYYKFYVCDGVRKQVNIRRIDTHFNTSANPPFTITRRLEWIEIKATHSGPYSWGVNPGKSCTNACTLQATVYPNKTLTYASTWLVGVWCDNCWPASGDKYELNHKFIPNTWTLTSWP